MDVMESKIERWIQESLSKFLECDVPPATVNNIMMLDNYLELEDYLNSLLNYDNPSHRLFMDKLLMKNERKYCECQCSQHTLINNCLSCGRIVCTLEGSGPCYFCGEIVCTYDELCLLRSRDVQKANAFYARLLSLERPCKTNGIPHHDNISDMRKSLSTFASNYHWKCSPLDRDMAQLNHLRMVEIKDIEKKRESDKTIKRLSHPTIDFYGWKNVQEGPTLRRMIEDLEARVQRNLSLKSELNEMQKMEAIKNDSPQMRVQDKGIQMMYDSKKCLAIDQPMASLLVCGMATQIITDWYSPIRGRLWIASTSLEVSERTASELKDTYSDSPKEYPTNSLLGYLTFEDCLIKDNIEESNLKQHPTNSSKGITLYIFVFSNPVALPVLLRIKGGRKIFTLESATHRAANELMASAKMAL